MSTIVAITGAKATGKTTLLHSLFDSVLLRSHYQDGIKVVPSPGRKAAELGLPLGSAGSDDTHLFFAKEHLENVRREKRENSEELILLDRCFIDHCAYVNKLSKSRPLKDLMGEMLSWYSQKLDRVLVTALVPPFSDNETATEPLGFRHEIEEEIWGLIVTLKVPATRLYDPAHRTAQAVSAILGSQ